MESVNYVALSTDYNLMKSPVFTHDGRRSKCGGKGSKIHHIVLFNLFSTRCSQQWSMAANLKRLTKRYLKQPLVIPEPSTREVTWQCLERWRNVKCKRQSVCFTGIEDNVQILTLAFRDVSLGIYNFVKSFLPCKVRLRDRTQFKGLA